MKKLITIITVAVVATSCTKKPEACFTVDNATVNTNQNINFNASCSSEATSYAWNFGDGTAGEGASVSHSYSTPANYTVTLTAKNKKSDAQTNQQITVIGSNPNDPQCVQDNFGFVKIYNSHDSNYEIKINGVYKGDVSGYGTSSPFQYPAGTSINVTITQIDGYLVYPSVFTGSGSITQCDTKTIIPS